MGQEFKLDKRYAKQLSLVFLILTFSGAMPFLNIFAFLYFFFVYYVDKVRTLVKRVEFVIRTQIETALCVLLLDAPLLLDHLASKYNCLH